MDRNDSGKPSPGNRFSSRTIRGLLALALMVATLDVTLRVTDWEDAPIRSWLLSRTGAAGIDLSIGSPIEATLLPLPRVRLGSVSLIARSDALRIDARSALLSILPSGFSMPMPTVRIEQATLGIGAPGNGEAFRIDTLDLDARIGWDLGSLLLNGKGDVDALPLAFLLEASFDGKSPTRLAARFGDNTLAFEGLMGDRAAAAIASGKVRLKMPSPAALLERRLPPGERLNLPPIARGSVDLEASLDVSRSRIRLADVEVGLGQTKGDGLLEVALSPLAVDGRLHFRQLALKDLMRERFDLLGLVNLFIDATTKLLDVMPPEGVAVLSIGIDDGSFNGRSVEGIAVDLDIRKDLGTIRRLVAHLPGDTAFSLDGRLEGPPGSRSMTARLDLHGEQPAQTLAWLMPSLAPASSPRSSPFSVTLGVKPASDGRHLAMADLALAGVRGHGEATFRIGPSILADARVEIGTLDPLSYIGTPGVLPLQSARLDGIALATRISLDPSREELLAVQSSTLTIREVRGVLQPVSATAPAPPEAVTTQPLAQVDAWLAELPRLVTATLRSDPERSVLARLFPTFEANLGQVDWAVGALNLEQPFELKIGRLRLDAAPHPGAMAAPRARVDDLSVTIAPRETQVGGRTIMSSLDIGTSAGGGETDNARLAHIDAGLRVELQRLGSRTKVKTLHVDRFSMQGDIEDPAPGATERLPFEIAAVAHVTPSRLDATFGRLSLGGIADFKDIDVVVEENRNGNLSAVVRTAAPSPGMPASQVRTGVGGVDGPLPSTCSVGAPPAVAERVIDVSIRLSGLDGSHGAIGHTSGRDRRAPLVGSLLLEGYVTPHTVVVDDLQARLGEASTVAARIAATATDRNGKPMLPRRIDGCFEVALQTAPRLPSVGHLLQGFLVPSLSMFWEGKSDIVGLNADGQLRLTGESLSSDPAVRLGITRRRAASAAQRPHPVETLDIELGALHLRAPPALSPTPLRVSFDRIRMSDGRGHLAFSGLAGSAPLFVLEQSGVPPPDCPRGSDIRMGVTLGRIESIDVPFLRRMASHAATALAGGDTKASPCDRLRVGFRADEIDVLPDVVDALTTSRAMADAASRVPPLRDISLDLALEGQDRIDYRFAARFEAHATTFQCRPATAGRGGLGGTGRLVRRRGHWDAELSGTITCIDLARTLAIAEAAGAALHNPAIRLKSGHIDKVSYTLGMPASGGALELAKSTGTLDWEGHVALSIDRALFRSGLGVLRLSALTRDGLPISGRLALKDGRLTGILASRDPATDDAGHHDHRYAAKWPDIAAITFDGSLADTTLRAAITVRSDDWKWVGKSLVCVDRERRAQLDHFPSWVTLVPICISLVGPGHCPRPAWRQMEERDYPCSTAGQ